MPRRRSGLAVEAVLETDCQFDLVLFGGGDHLFALVRIHRHRLFHHDVAAGGGGGERGGAVHAVRGADVDRVRLDRLEEVVPLLEALLRLHAVFFLVFGELRGIDVAEADQFDLRNLLVSRHVGLADSAAADDGHAQFLRSGRSLLYRRLLDRSFLSRRTFRCHDSDSSLAIHVVSPFPATADKLPETRQIKLLFRPVFLPERSRPASIIPHHSGNASPKKQPIVIFFPFFLCESYSPPVCISRQRGICCFPPE